MTGLNSNTGKSLKGLDHLRQSIEDILVTPVGSRVMRREYGSKLFELIDAPLNRGTLAQIYAASAEALDRWEPRFKLRKIRADSITPGTITPGTINIELEGEYLPEGKIVKLNNLIL